MKENHTYCNFNYNSNRIHDSLKSFTKFSNPGSHSSYHGVTAGSLSLKEIIRVQSILNIDLPIHYILYFKLNPMGIGRIHKDVTIEELSSPRSYYAFNIPVLNGDAIVMNWYEKIDDNIANLEHESRFTNTAHTPYLQESNAKKIMAATLNKPSLVKIDDWHSVDNTSNSSSELLSIRFSAKVTKQQIINYFN